MTLPATQFLKDHFNDPDGVIGLLDKHRPASPKRMAVVKWFERNSIPGEWWPELQKALFAENGEWPDLFAYDTPDEDIFG